MTDSQLSVKKGMNMGTNTTAATDTPADTMEAIAGMEAAMEATLAAIQEGIQEATDEWYEVHDCLGCGQRILIDSGESKADYNQRLYHGQRCEDAKRDETPINHGTQYGYTRCRERPEGSCDQCRAENARRRRKEPAQVRRNALTQLARKYEEELEALIRELS